MILGLVPFARGANILFGTASSEAASAVVAPIIRDISYRTNRALGPLLPLVPDISALVRLYHRGKLDRRELFQWLSFHGVDPLSEIWSRLISSSGNFPGVDTFLRNYHRGFLTEDATQALRGELGVRDNDAWRVFSRNAFDWSPNDVRILKSIQGFDAGSYVPMQKSAGLLHPDDRHYFDLLYQPTTPTETLALLNRKDITPEKAEELLKLAGMTEDETRAAFKKLGSVIPSPSDLVRFSVKEVWNKEVVDRFGYDDEFDQIPAFREWMSRSGMGGSAALPNLGPGQPESWSQAFWRAHWRTISPTQAYVMLHRLRPTGGPGGGPRVPTFTFTENGIEKTVQVPPVTIDDVASILKINDYPPSMRARLAAISYLPFRLVDIRRIVYLCESSSAHRNEIIGQGVSVQRWATEQYMDRGQTREQAIILARSSIIAAHRQRQIELDRRHKTATRGRTGQALKLFDIGLKTREETRIALNNLHMDNQEVDDTLAYIDGKQKFEDTKQTIAWVQRQVMKAYISPEMGAEILKKIGLTDMAVTRNSKKWQLIMDESHRINVTQEALGEFRQGLTDYQSTLERLQNLGWENAQALLDAVPYEDMVNPSP